MYRYGLGERAGNAPLSSVLAVLHDQLHYQHRLMKNTFQSKAAWSKPILEYGYRQIAP